MADQPVMKACGCGRQYTIKEWNDLPYVGVQEDPSVDDLELRNCACGSTLAVTLDVLSCYDHAASSSCGGCIASVLRDWRTEYRTKKQIILRAAEVLRHVEHDDSPMEAIVAIRAIGGGYATQLAVALAMPHFEHGGTATEILGRTIAAF